MARGSQAIKTPNSQPDKLDWQIIQSLRYDSLSSAKELAEALAITPRMAEYRISKLLDSRSILIRAIIDTQKQQGLIFYELEISVDEHKQFEVVKELSDMYGEKLWSIRTLASGGFLLANFFGFTLAEPEEAVVRAAKLEGVHSCSLFIIKETIEPQRPNWVDGLISREIDSAKLQMK